jgi:hypothetical protein
LEILGPGTTYQFAAAKFVDEGSGQSLVTAMRGIPAEHFDGILYLEQSPAMTSASPGGN